ncbi:hypothetical protein GOP47_0009062 [Adiantum capillus-veneris]|uniref:Ferredoxin n=1 Tax=Adiantum capillus-veneris TaxID=13818 RepID=A0A9D4V0B7_ADICA|nr:hypothetical protein GOP47_0009062 [Adiantum capillus-veneris]
MFAFHAPIPCALWSPWKVNNKLKIRGRLHIDPQWSRCRAACAVASSETRSFKVTLQTPSGEKAIEAAEDAYIVDAAESAGVNLPVSCRSGNCSSCAAVLKSGQVDQSNQVFLDDDQVSQGFILTCVAYPLSDIVLETHQEARLYS